MALAADGVAGPPAVVAAAALEDDVVSGPHPPPGDEPWRSRTTASQALLPPSPPPLRPTPSTSTDAAGDATRSSVVAVGAVNADVDPTVVDLVLNFARRGR